MRRDYIKWYSPSLGRGYGTAGIRPRRVSDRGLPDFGRPLLRVRGPRHGARAGSQDRSRRAAGDLRRFGGSGILVQPAIAPADRLHRQNAFDAYLALEVAPFVRNRTTWGQMGTTGCSFGGYHAINFALRHPDIVTYAVSMSGAFDVPRQFLDGYYNSDAYFNSPLDSLPNLEDPWFLERMRRSYYVLVVGNGDSLFDQNVKLAHLFGIKGCRTSWTCGRASATTGHGGRRWPTSIL